MKILFKTNITMKEYNRKKWWIDKNIIKDYMINSKDLKEAFEKYRNIAKEQGIDISNSALKNKKAMYIDTKEGAKQIGYVITGRTDFQDEHDNWIKQYIDLWIEILEVRDIIFE